MPKTRRGASDADKALLREAIIAELENKHISQNALYNAIRGRCEGYTANKATIRKVMNEILEGQRRRESKVVPKAAASPLAQVIPVDASTQSIHEVMGQYIKRLYDAMCEHKNVKSIRIENNGRVEIVAATEVNL